MKNETKPNWLVPKIHGRAKKREEDSSQRALTVPHPVEVKLQSPEQVLDMVSSCSLGKL